MGNGIVENTTQQDEKRVTIVVPIYADWDSLRECVVSLLEHADPERYDVLLVNDVGPDADEIEAGLLGLTAGMSQFRYERNPENLGFVRTCNRAVFELDSSNNDILLLNSDAVVTAGALDELRATLNADPRHAAVCPRSNDATIASIPFFRREASAPRPGARARATFDAVSASLPRYYIAPVAVGFCLLLRRDLIEKHGLFDEVFGMGYSEENDLCLRLNALGYSAVIANHAFVFHVGSSSFGAEQRRELDARNSRVVVERYPFYPSSVITFIQNSYHPIDRFAELLTSFDDKFPPSVLLTVSTTVEAELQSRRMADLQTLLSELVPHSTVTIAVARPWLSALSASMGDRATVVELDTLETVFDVGMSVGVPSTVRHLAALNRHCLRWAIDVDDLRDLRSWASLSHDPQIIPVSRAGLMFADVVRWRPAVDRAEAARLLHLDIVDRGTDGRSDGQQSHPWFQDALRDESRPHEALHAFLEHRESVVAPWSVIAQGAARDGAERQLAAISASGSYRLAHTASAALSRLRRR